MQTFLMILQAIGGATVIMLAGAFLFGAWSELRRQWRQHRGAK